MTKLKVMFANQQEAETHQKNNRMAGNGMILPPALQQEGKEFNVTALGENGSAVTKKTALLSEENWEWWYFSKVQFPEGQSLNVSIMQYLAKGTKHRVRVNRTPATEGQTRDLWSLEYLGVADNKTVVPETKGKKVGRGVN